MATTVHKILEQRPATVFPGVFDALSALVAQKAGFDMAFISGYSASASHLGMPDFGYLDGSAICDIARRVCSAASIPVIVDADTGYGNPLNVRKTVRDLIAAGAKGCFLEDQEWPKRCGHMSGKSVISRKDYASKLRAAVDEKGDADFFLVARTDALATEGMEEALARMRDAKAIGADGFFVEAPKSREEMERICREAPKPLVANMIEGGATPVLPLDDLAGIGYSLVLYPLSGLYSAAKALAQTYGRICSEGTSAQDGEAMDFGEFNETIGLERHYSLSERYKPD